MIELGELERRHADFAQRNTRIVVVSLESPEEARKTQADFPHLVVVADQDKGLSLVADALHSRSGPGGSETAAPASLLVDRTGIVRWVYRPDRFLSRPSPEEILAAIDRNVSR
jgi:peroxiredoxin